MSIGKVIRIVIAVAVMGGTAVWAFTSTRESTYSGSDVSFEMNGGSVILTNKGDEPATVHMTKKGRSANFTAVSANLGLDNQRSTSAGSGNNTVHTVEFELPSGEADLRLTRGSGVTVTIEGVSVVDVVTKPMNNDQIRNTWLFVLVVFLGAIFYIARTINRQWMGWLRQRVMVGRPEAAEQPSI